MQQETKPSEVQQEPKGQFAAVAEIGKGRFPLTTTRGVVRIDAGVLTMRKHTGDAIGDDSPVSGMRARGQHGSAGGAVRIWVGDRTYLLKWDPSASATAGGLAATVAGGVSVGRASKAALGLPKQRKITQEFLAAVEANGGQAG